MIKKYILSLFFCISIPAFAQMVAPPTTLPPRPVGSLSELPGLPVFNNPTLIKDFVKEKAIKKQKEFVPPKKDEDFSSTGNVLKDLFLFKPVKFYTNGKLNDDGMDMIAKNRSLAVSKEVMPAVIMCQREMTLLIRESMASPGLFDWVFYQHPDYGSYLRSKITTRSAFDANHQFDVVCAIESQPSGIWVMNKNKFNNGLFIVRDY